MHVQTLLGTPAGALIEQAQRAYLLVVGHRGRGGFASAPLGSVGMHCILHATCPVTIVRPASQATADGHRSLADELLAEANATVVSS